MNHRVFAAFGIGMVWLAATGGAWATDYYVTTNGLDTAAGTNWAMAWRTITNAVAQSADGDTINVSNGTYVTLAEIAVTKGVSILGANGAGQTAVCRGTTTSNRVSSRHLAHGPNTFAVSSTPTKYPPAIRSTRTVVPSGTTTWYDSPPRTTGAISIV